MELPPQQQGQLKFPPQQTDPTNAVGVVPTGEIGTNLLSVLVAATIGTTRVTSATGLPADL